MYSGCGADANSLPAGLGDAWLLNCLTPARVPANADAFVSRVALGVVREPRNAIVFFYLIGHHLVPHS